MASDKPAPLPVNVPPPAPAGAGEAACLGSGPGGGARVLDLGTRPAAAAEMAVGSMVSISGINPSVPIRNIKMKFAVVIGLIQVGEVSNRDIVETVLNLNHGILTVQKKALWPTKPAPTLWKSTLPMPLPYPCNPS